MSRRRKSIVELLQIAAALQSFVKLRKDEQEKEIAKKAEKTQPLDNCEFYFQVYQSLVCRDCEATFGGNHESSGRKFRDWVTRQASVL